MLFFKSLAKNTLRQILFFFPILLINLPFEVNAERKWPTGPLMVSKGDMNWYEHVPVGNIATAPEICEVFQHPFFKSRIQDFDLLDSINSEWRWDGIEASNLWIKMKFQKAGINVRRLGIDEDSAAIADYNLTGCFNAINQQTPELFRLIRRNLLHYISGECLEQKYRVEKSVDNAGNISEKKIPLKKMSCLNFNYNSGRYSQYK